MKRVQLIHQLNNTELGKTGMADCYLNVSKDIHLHDVIPNSSNSNKVYFSMFFRYNSKTYDTFRFENGGEQRLYGFGKLFKLVDAQAGDYVVIDNYDGKVFVEIIKFENVVVFLKQGSKGYIQVLNESRIEKLLNRDTEVYYNNQFVKFGLKHYGSWKKRSDAQKETDFYNIYINGQEITSSLPKDSYFRLVISSYCNLFSLSDKDKLITVKY